jgi:lysozyme
MQASVNCYNFIKKMEGYSATAYNDGSNVQTIGWGTIRYDMKTPVKHGDTITVEEAQRQLEIEVHRVEDAINSTVKVDLNQAEFDCLTSLFYNIGTGWCTGTKNNKPPQSTLIKLLNKGKYSAVPAQLLLFERDIHGKYVPGLLTRRKWESKLWLSDTSHEHIVAAAPETDPAVAPMPQAVTPAKAERTITTIAKSPSVHSAGVGIIAGIGAFLDNVFGWTKQTAQQAVDVTNDLGPVQTLVGTLSHSAVQIGFGITVLALAYVLWRRFRAAAEGRSF